MKKIGTTIVLDPNIRGGKPTLRGTRITVDEALGFLESGMDYAAIQREYSLTRVQLQAAIAYANAFLKGEELLSPRQSARPA